MKRKLVVLGLTMIFISSFCFAVYNVPLRGSWAGSSIRAMLPQPPKALIDGNVLYFEFDNSLSDVKVVVTSETGNVIYDEVIAGWGGEVYTVPVAFEEGVYQISITHPFGYLAGEFMIEE